MRSFLPIGIYFRMKKRNIHSIGGSCFVFSLSERCSYYSERYASSYFQRSNSIYKVFTFKNVLLWKFYVGCGFFGRFECVCSDAICIQWVVVCVFRSIRFFCWGFLVCWGRKLHVECYVSLVYSYKLFFWLKFSLHTDNPILLYETLRCDSAWGWKCIHFTMNKIVLYTSNTYKRRQTND